MSQHWYEHWLRKAAGQERAGRVAAAVKSLDKAEKHTSDEDELFYLGLWRDRLKKMVAGAAK